MKLLALISLILFPLAALASPGAHGPNGEHLDAPAAAATAAAVPRIETFSETFELVGHLRQDELSILVDRYDTNEPVLGAALEVEFNGVKAPAKFHADHGDYAVDDPRLLKALAAPGKHGLVFTLIAGDDSDLLEGTLEVAADSHGDRAAFPWKLALAALAATLALAAIAVRMTRKAPAHRRPS